MKKDLDLENLKPLENKENISFIKDSIFNIIVLIQIKDLKIL